MLYGCDGDWWNLHNGVPEFKGIKVSQDAAACVRFLDVAKVEVRIDSDQVLVDVPGVIGSGGNSGFQALNLAIQFGAMRIMLVGLDMHMTAGVHWHGDHGKGLNNPRDPNFVKWRRAFEGAAEAIHDLGVDVVNTSLDSALTVFPKMTAEEAMKRWRL